MMRRSVLVSFIFAIIFIASLALAQDNAAPTSDQLRTVTKATEELSARNTKLQAAVEKIAAQVKSSSDFETKAKEAIANLKAEISELKSMLQNALRENEAIKTAHAELAKKAAESFTSPFASVMPYVSRATDIASNAYKTVTVKSAPYVKMAQQYAQKYGGAAYVQATKYAEEAQSAIADIRTQGAKPTFDRLYAKFMIVSNKVAGQLQKWGLPAQSAVLVAQSLVLFLSFLSGLVAIYSFFSIISLFFGCLRFVFCCARGGPKRKAQ